MVPVWHDFQKLFVVVDPDSSILVRIGLGDLQRTVRAAIIYDNVLPVLVCLSQYAFNAFGDMFGPVIYRGYYADEWLR